MGAAWRDLAGVAGGRGNLMILNTLQQAQAHGLIHYLMPTRSVRNPRNFQAGLEPRKGRVSKPSDKGGGLQESFRSSRCLMACNLSRRDCDICENLRGGLWSWRTLSGVVYMCVFACLRGCGRGRGRGYGRAEACMCACARARARAGACAYVCVCVCA